MSVEFDILLCDPEPATLLNVLGRLGVAGVPAAEIVRRTIDDAEGTSLASRVVGWSDDTRLTTVAWWTDAGDRQHVRVVCEPDDDARRLHHPRLDHDPRPPLWHVNPGRVLAVTWPGDKARWLVACSCGEVGEPESVLWTGGRCGPCHDRREEGDPAAPPDRTALHRLGGAVGDLAFTDSGLFAAVSGNPHRLVRLSHDGSPPADFAPPTDRPLVGPIEPMALSPDGRFLATGHADSRFVRVADLREDAAQLLTLPGYHGQRDIRLAFSPMETALLVVKQGIRTHVWEHDGRYWRLHFTDWPSARAFAFSPSGDAVALGSGDGSVTIRDARTGAVSESFFPDEYRREVLFADYLADGDTLLLLLNRGGDGNHQAALTLSLSRRRVLRATDLEDGFASAVLTPGGDYLAGYRSGPTSSPASLDFYRTADLAHAGTIEWHPEEQLSAMAFSADGRLAAVGSRRGNVVVFPWRELLEGGRG